MRRTVPPSLRPTVQSSILLYSIKIVSSKVQSKIAFENDLLNIESDHYKTTNHVIGEKLFQDRGFYIFFLHLVRKTLLQLSD